MEGILMTVIKSRSGLPNPIIWVITFLIPTILLWLPREILSPWGILIFSISSITFIYPFITLTPRPKMLSAIDDCNIATITKTMRLSEIILIRAVDCGRATGWVLEVFRKYLTNPVFSVPLDMVQDKSDLVESIPETIPTATLTATRKKWGNAMDWMLALAIAIFLTGLVRFILLLLIA